MGLVQYNNIFPGICIPITKIRAAWLIYHYIGNCILIRWHIYIEKTPMFYAPSLFLNIPNHHLNCCMKWSNEWNDLIMLVSVRLSSWVRFYGPLCFHCDVMPLIVKKTSKCNRFQRPKFERDSCQIWKGLTKIRLAKCLFASVYILCQQWVWVYWGHVLCFPRYGKTWMVPTQIIQTHESFIHGLWNHKYQIYIGSEMCMNKAHHNKNEL